MNKDAEQNILIYHTADGKAAVSLYARDGNVWMNQSQLAELFATSVANISTHISKILKEKELDRNSVVKDYLTTAADCSKIRSFCITLLGDNLFPPFMIASKRLRSVPSN